MPVWPASLVGGGQAPVLQRWSKSSLCPTSSGPGAIYPTPSLSALTSKQGPNSRKPGWPRWKPRTVEVDSDSSGHAIYVWRTTRMQAWPAKWLGWWPYMPTACDIHSTAFRRQRPAPKGQIQWERPTGMKTPDRKQRVLKGIQTGVCHRPHHVFRSHVPPSCTVTVLETALPLFNENVNNSH